MDYFPHMGMACCALHLTTNQPVSAVMSETYILVQIRDCKKQNVVDCVGLDLYQTRGA